MANIQSSLFDYSILQPEVAGEARAAAERIKVRMKRTAEDIVEIGRDLIDVKEKLGHGQFGEWIKAEFDMSQNSAIRIMQVAQSFSDKFTNLVNLNPSVLYQLAAPSTPDEVVDQAIQKAESGEKVSIKEIQEWKKKVKEEADARAEWERRSEEWRQQWKATKAEADRIQSELAELKARPPQKIIPDGYATLEQAIEAKRRELTDQERQLKQFESEQQKIKGDIARVKAEERKRQNAKAEQEAKLSRLIGFRNRLKGFLKDTADHQLALATPAINAEIAAELEAIEDLLLTLVERIQKTRSYAGHYEQESRALIGEVV